MVTRLRRFSRSKGLKAAAFILDVVFITAIMLQLVYLFYRDFDLEPLFVKEYRQSREFIDNDLTPAIEKLVKYIATDKGWEQEFDCYYYYNDGEKFYNNISLSELEKYNYIYECNIQTWNYNINSANNVDGAKKNILYLAFPEDYIQQKQEMWDSIRTELVTIAVSFIISVIAAVIFFVYLIVVAGRKAEDDDVHLSPYSDRIYSDVLAGIIILTVYVWFFFTYNLLKRSRYRSGSLAIGMDQKVSLIIIGIITAIAAIICLDLLISMIRKIKAKKLIKHSLIYIILSGISNFIRSFFNDSRFEHYPLTKSLYRRQVIFTVSSGIMVILSFILIFINIFAGFLPVMLEAVIIFWYFYENNKTYDEINNGLQEGYKEMMKSEKMKVDLITNVSHDLKTPLTSIISYVELLSKEDLPETARDYVKILSEKSERLKNIVSDLFDLAKSTSGNLPLDLEYLDLKKLIEQTLADMGDDIEKSNMRIKTTLTENPVYIYSDGKKLYRVFQNIIGNALKYSLQGTRIYIDMEIINNRVNVTVKNTASYEMDFTAEEILQRFSRGDKSRSTEGSGLGLSIAESFTRACGGTFRVEIDGDQFRVKLGFPISVMAEQ